MSPKASQATSEAFLAARRHGHKDQKGSIDDGRQDGLLARADGHHHGVDPESTIDRENNPVDAWRLIERVPNRMDLGVSESIFALSNGYMGMRANPSEGRDSAYHGTYINGLHETWNIRHAEDAYGLARKGQTLVSAPDAKPMRLYIDDEPLRLGSADLEDYERTLDFREGILRRNLIWRTPSGKRVRVTSERMISFQENHLAIMSLEVELLDSDAAVVISSQILNRQDGEDEYHGGGNGSSANSAAEKDPRQGETIEARVLIPTFRAHPAPERATLGYRCAESGMTVTCSMDHRLTVDMPGAESLKTREEAGVEVDARVRDDNARVVHHLNGKQGMTIRLEKFVSYHSSRHVAAEELAFRCARTINRAVQVGFPALQQNQREWLDAFWQRSDVEITGQPTIQQAVRWNLFQLVQASARADGHGIPAKGMTGSGYGGHYFWDTEIYVMPFLSYTNPSFARNAMRFRFLMLPAAQERARELSHDGALFPWRTINGLESSAYYAAGTAQYHIDADIAYALMKYVYASGDTDFLLREGIHILVGTARFWMSLGFFDRDGEFNIHSVTGPDEYTTVVNNNLYTNVMAEYNLRVAADVVRQMKADRPNDYADLAKQYGLDEEEIELWDKAAEHMHILLDPKLGIHPQDDQFLERERWNLDDPAVGPKRPLLLHYHPLTIYRYQIIKQADVVLALFLRGNRFTREEKLADYNYYDELTTGDSTLSAVVQSIVAAELDLKDKAMDFFLRGLFVDLGNLHGNTKDGVHIASTGGVWSALVYGFGGFRDYEGRYSINPRLPDEWEELIYRITLHGCRIRVAIRRHSVELVVEEGLHDVGPIEVGGREVVVTHEPMTIALPGERNLDDD